jgi:hypothetical protein
LRRWRCGLELLRYRSGGLGLHQDLGRLLISGPVEVGAQDA